MKDRDTLLNPILLREEGMKHLRNLAGNTWTDHNPHDPGITILEQLVFALADLNYRTNFDVKDLLMLPPESEEASHQLFTAREVLPSHSITINDYRKLILDVEGIRNVWIIPVKQTDTIYKSQDRTVLNYTSQAGATRTDTLEIRGLYKVLVDFDLNLEQHEEVTIKAKVWDRLMANRNLGEDFLDMEIVKKEEIGLTAQIELETNASVEESLAELYYQINQFLIPPPKFYSLGELLEKGVPPHEIFEGPALDHGFILTEELPKQRNNVHISDLVQIIMDIKGVKAIKNMHGASYPDGIVFRSGQRWCIRLNSDLNYSPVLNPYRCNVEFVKNGIVYQADNNEVIQLLRAKKQKDNLARYAAKLRNDLEIPKGTYRNVHDYFSIQNNFPLNYGIGAAGLPANASPLRRAQAKQLKAYLLIFEKLIADYHMQLAHVGDLFSNNFSGIQTYFSQRPEATETANIYVGEDDFTEVPQEDTAMSGKRAIHFLDHKLGRFAEQASDYPLLSSGLSGRKPIDEQIKDKVALLKDLSSIGNIRAKGFNYKSPQLNTENVAGLQRRICRLLGIHDYKSKWITKTTSLFEVYQSETSGDWRFRLRNDQEDILLYSNKGYASEDNCLDEVQNAIDQGAYAANYEFNIAADGKHYLTLKAKDDGLVARGPSKNARENVENAILEILRMLNPEGFYLVEHILLRPEISLVEGAKLTGNHFLPIYPEHSYYTPWKEDPYSSLITLVIPEDGERFSNREFRNYAERIICQETPAHLKIHVHWVNRVVMKNFETAYWNWTESLKEKIQYPEQYLTSARDLVVELRKLYQEKRFIGSHAYTPQQSVPFTVEDPWTILDKLLFKGVGEMRIGRNFIVHTIRSDWRKLLNLGIGYMTVEESFKIQPGKSKQGDLFNNSILQLVYSGSGKRGNRGTGVMTLYNTPVPNDAEKVKLQYTMGTDVYSEVGLFFDWVDGENYKLFYYSQYEKRVIVAQVQGEVVHNIMDTSVTDLSGASITLTLERFENKLFCRQRSPDTIGAEFMLNTITFPAGRHVGLFTRYCDDAVFQEMDITGPNWKDKIISSGI